MRRTYRSKKNTEGGIDHRDMILSVDSKSSVFDAYYIQNIKQVKREMSCVNSFNPYTAASYKVRKRKYVKRLKEPEPLRESESAYLTPDKSIHVNRTPDLFDQLLNSSTSTFSPKTTPTSHNNVQNLVRPRIANKAYCRKKLTRVNKLKHFSHEDSDKENSLSDETHSHNTSNVKAHKLVIERERIFSPIHLDDSINKIAEKFPALNKLSKANINESTNGSDRFSNLLLNVIQSPVPKTSPQCSTPFHAKYRGKSIYNFSPISINLLEESVKLIDESTVISDHQNNQHSRSDNKIIKSITNMENSRGSFNINCTENYIDNLLQEKENIEYDVTMAKYSFKNEMFLNNDTSSINTTELKPFLGFPFNSSAQDIKCDANKLENIEKELASNITTDGSIADTHVLLKQSVCKSIDNINSGSESSTQSNINIEDLKNRTTSSMSDVVDSESLYDTCDSENISDLSSLEDIKPKELVVTVERMNDSIFWKFYNKMFDLSLKETSSNNDSSDNEIVSNINESDYESFEVESHDNISSIFLNNSDKDRFNRENLGSIDVQVISSSENENSDSNDIEEGNKYCSFVTTRKRIDLTNDSFMLNLDNSSNSASNSTLDKTVLSCNRNSLKETELIEDNTLVNDFIGTNVYNDNTEFKEQIVFDRQQLPIANELTEPLESVQIVSDEEVTNINTRKSSRLFRDSSNRLSHTDETSSSLRQGIVLKPGKKWERSLSIYRRMTTMGDTINHSILDDESMKVRGRKYRQSVINIMEMQESQGSLHNESVFSRRSTFVSKPRKSAIKIFRDPNASNISLSTSVLYDDLEGFLNGDCDDTIIELSKLSIGDSGHEVTVLDKFHDTTNRIVTARDYVLRRCNQTEPVLFDECYPDTVLKNCRKIGEGVYGEVFLWRAGDGRARVMKIVPIAGTTKVNGEEQKDYHEIISEIVIAMELSALRAPIPEIERQLDDGKEIDALDLHSVQNATDVFNEVLAIRCVYGAYPSRLLDLWELYDECKGSENDNPAALPVDQQYIVLELANAGQDLESYQFTNAEQACALFKQIALGLAVAEEAIQFEHRDLHWGNVLIAPTDQKYATFVIRGRLYRTPRCGVAATLIDYSLSRAARDGRALYNDLAEDDALFDAVGDYQFEVYRLMRDKLGNDWKNFEPYTNILWLHYTVDKMITALRYARTNTKIHKHYIAKLKEIKNRVLDYGSATQFILTDNEF